MKRSAMPRRTAALKRAKTFSAGPLTQIKRQRRPNPEKDRAFRLAVVDVKARSNGLCEARVSEQCSGRGEHRHHIILRSAGGPDEAWNLLNVCHHCHGWIHGNVADAKKRGFIRSRAVR